MDFAGPPSRARETVSVADLTMDLDAYMSGYEGPMQLTRLEFIAQVVPDLRFDALRLSLTYLRNSSCNTQQYLALADILENEFKNKLHACGCSGLIDREWASKTSAQADNIQRELEVTAREASLAQKEAVIATNNLVDFYIDRGLFKLALTEHGSLDKNISTQEFGSYAVKMIQLVLLNSQYARISDWAHNTATRVKDNKKALCIAGVARAIAELKFSRYSVSADYIMETPFDITEELGYLVKPNDVATFGTLCALAAYDRQQIRSVMDNGNFKKFLEYEPDCQAILTHYMKAQYRECFQILEKRKADFLLDIHLHKHVATLFKMIFDRSIILYFKPYSAVSLATMAQNLGFDIKVLQEKIVALVERRLIDCLINTHDMVLTRRTRDDRCQTFSKVLENAADFEMKVKGTILHVNLHKANIMVYPAGAKRGGRELSKNSRDEVGLHDDITGYPDSAKQRGRGQSMHPGDDMDLYEDILE